MKKTGPYEEHIRLCLQLILQSSLHRLDVGLTEEKVLEICAASGIQYAPSTHEKRLSLMQKLAAKILSESN